MKAFESKNIVVCTVIPYIQKRKFSLNRSCLQFDRKAMLSASFTQNANIFLGKELKAEMFLCVSFMELFFFFINTLILYRCLVYFRWVYEKYAHSLALVVPKYVLFFMKRKVKQQLYAQGTGRHSTEEIKKKLIQDLEALSAQLGKFTEKFVHCGF